MNKSQYTQANRNMRSALRALKAQGQGPTLNLLAQDWVARVEHDIAWKFGITIRDHVRDAAEWSSLGLPDSFFPATNNSFNSEVVESINLKYGLMERAA